MQQKFSAAGFSVVEIRNGHFEGPYPQPMPRCVFAFLSDHIPEKSTWGSNLSLINNFCKSGSSTIAETKTYFTITDCDIPRTLNLNSLALLHS